MNIPRTREEKSIRATHAVDKAIAEIILREPWYASLLLRLSRRRTDQIPTIGTNGRELIYNPDWIFTTTPPELLGVLLHETLHCALLHITRCGNRNELFWNIACDRVVNAVVISSGYHLPEGYVPPADLSRTAEEEYKDLMKHITIKNRIIKIGNPGQDLIEREGESADAVGTTALENEWKEAVAAAPGLTPSNVKRYITDVLTPKHPWRELLTSWMTTYRPTSEYTWTRPNRRIPGLPGKKSIPTGMIVVVLDTSGSITHEDLSQFHSELQSILHSLPDSRVYCMSADAAIHEIVEPGEPMPPIWTGGGGTDFRPALSWAEEHDIDAIVYFTDGAGTFPNACVVPVCWVIPSPSTPAIPFGIVVSMVT